VNDDVIIFDDSSSSSSGVSSFNKAGEKKDKRKKGREQSNPYAVIKHVRVMAPLSHFFGLAFHPPGIWYCLYI
jgi:hypothetical protein